MDKMAVLVYYPRRCLFVFLATCIAECTANNCFLGNPKIVTHPNKFWQRFCPRILLGLALSTWRFRCLQSHRYLRACFRLLLERQPHTCYYGSAVTVFKPNFRQVIMSQRDSHQCSRFRCVVPAGPVQIGKQV